MSRLFSGTAFAAAILAFTLPFGSVSSCDGETVSFTGAQLTTFSVPPDASEHGTLHDKVERNGSMLALATLLAAVLGLLFAIVGRAGGGVCASLGLLAIQLLAWAVLFTSDGGSSLFAGFWFALVSLAIAAALHLVRALRARRRSGDSLWGFAVGRTALVFLPTLALVALVVVAVASG